MNKRDITTTFAMNIEREREKMGFTQAEMAKELDMTTASYKYLVSGNSANSPLYTAYRASQTTGKTILELCGVVTPEINAIAMFRDLPKHRQKAILTLIQMEHQLATDVDSTTPSEDDMVPLYTALGNMKDGMFYMASDINYVNISSYRKQYGSLIDCAVRITSNHLHPAFHMGDMLLVAQQPPRDGDIGIFINKTNGRLYIRKFLQTSPCTLEPITNFGSPIYVDKYDSNEMKQWIKFGYIITKAR